MHAPTKLNSLSVFVPVYNEEANIGLIIEDALLYLPKVAHKYELIIVNDGSTDETIRIVNSYLSQYSVIRLVSHRQNRGYGAAVKTGLKTARYDWIFFTDSDRQFRFDELPQFLAHRHGVDFVIGYRIKRQDSLWRLILAQGFLRLWNYLLFGLTLRDIDCAYKLLPKSAIAKIKLDTESAITVTELLYRLIKLGLSYREVPVTHYPRPYGRQTGNDPRVIIRALKESLMLWQKIRA